jgi:hypothetical protein
MKEETIELLSKGKKVLQIVKEETLELPKTKNHQDESIIGYKTRFTRKVSISSFTFNG